MNQQELKKAQKFAEEIAKKAGALLLKKAGKSQIAVEKGESDFATEADLASEKLILTAIQKAYPDHEILAEESGNSEQKSDYRWVIDPLDGTKNFFHGLPFWCVSIALQKNKQSIVGVVYAPVTGDLFSACSGGGAKRGGRKIKVAEKKSLTEATGIIEMPRKKAAGLLSFGQQKKIFLPVLDATRRVRNFGASAYELCLVASGVGDFYIDFSRETKVWDTAAGSLIAAEAGASVIDITPEKARKFEKAFLVADPVLAKKLQKMI